MAVYKRKGVYWIDYRDADGKRIRRAAGTDKVAAGQMLKEINLLEKQKKLIRQVKAEQEAKRHLSDEKRVKLTDVWDAYETNPEVRRNLRPRSFENYLNDFRMIHEDLGLKFVDEVTPEEVKRLREKYFRDNISSATVKRKEAALKVVLNWAAEQGMIAENPVKNLKPPKNVPKTQRRDLQEDELEALFDKCPDERYHLWLMFASTGLRSREVSEMKVSWIDFRRGEVTVPREVNKNGKLKTVPLPEEIIAWVKSQKKNTEDYVFTNQAGNPLNKTTILRWLRRDLKAAGIPDENVRGKVVVHSFRITAITRLLESGVDPKLVMEIVGHSSLKMTMEIYARVSNDRKHEAVNNLPYVKRGRRPNVVRLHSETG